MNLISCCEDCEYQLDGYCNLEEMRVQGARKVDGCCYYQKRKILKSAQPEPEKAPPIC